MEQEKLWAHFEKTGRVQDYLQYRGVDVAEPTAERHEEEPHEPDNRRADHSGE